MANKDPKLICNGLLTESDVISLSVSLRVDGRILHDDANGACHTLNPRVVFLLQRLHGKIPYLEWLKIAKRRKIKAREAGEILLFLNSIGGLKIDRKLIGHLNTIIFRFKMFRYGFKQKQLTRRWTLSIWSIMSGVTIASALIGILVPASVIVLYAVGFTAFEASFYPLVTFFLFWTSTVMHELAHAVFLDDKAVVLQRGTRIGILHSQMSKSVELVSAICGPLTGAITLVVLGWLTGKYTSLVYAQQITAALIVAQFWSLMPWYGDGAAIWKFNETNMEDPTWKYLKEAKDSK